MSKSLDKAIARFNHATAFLVDGSNLIASINDGLTEAVNTAEGLIDDAKRMATAKVEAKRYSNCVSCQLLMENFLLAYPNASQRGKDEYFSEVVFPTCNPCTTEYNAYLDTLEPPEDVVLDCESEWEKRNLWKGGAR